MSSKFIIIIMLVHALAVMLQGAPATHLINLVPMSYHLDNANSQIQPLITQGLPDNANGIARYIWLILCKEPPFSHPILIQAVNMLTFQGHSPIASVAPDLFLSLIVLALFACTLVHFTLDHHVPGADSNKHMKFTADNYHPIYRGPEVH
ncbi:hypothetical protein K439DRAFT_1613772 [Ramaria rubella]|nr:hypothetical protein K439DRAFT_1613772 [Ramaria rubella]